MAQFPMGAVGLRDEIYETMTGAAPENAIEFFHGYTYSAHPAACAAGNARCRSTSDDGLFEKAAAMSRPILSTRSGRCRTSPWCATCAVSA